MINWINKSSELPPRKPPDGNYYLDSENVLLFREGHAIMEGCYSYSSKTWMPYNPTHWANINYPNDKDKNCPE